MKNKTSLRVYNVTRIFRKTRVKRIYIYILDIILKLTRVYKSIHIIVGSSNATRSNVVITYQIYLLRRIYRSCLHASTTYYGSSGCDCCAQAARPTTRQIKSYIILISWAIPLRLDISTRNRIEIVELCSTAFQKHLSFYNNF